MEFTYKSKNFNSKIIAKGVWLDKTKYFIGENEIIVDILYCNGKIHHVYDGESINEIEVKKAF